MQAKTLLGLDRLVLFLLFVLSFSLVSKTLHAESFYDIEVSDDKKLNIAFFPMNIPIYLYDGTSLGSAQDIDTAAFRQSILAHASSHPYLHAITRKDLVRMYREAELEEVDSYAQAKIDIGYAETHLSNMNYALAVSLLERVNRNYNEVLAQYLDPNAVAHAQRLLAYAYLSKIREEAQELSSIDFFHPARLAFMESIRLAPHITLLEGRQPPDRIAVYNEAKKLFLDSDVYRQVQVSDAARLAKRLNSQLVVFMRIVQDIEGQLSLEFDYYDALKKEMTKQKILMDSSIPAEQFQAHAVDLASAFLESQYICIDIAPNKEVKRGESGRFYFDFGASYFTYLKYPTQGRVHSVGGSFKLTYMFNENFFIHGGMDVGSVLQDSAKDLYAPFEYVRFYINLGISRNFKWIRPYISAGLEIGYTSAYSITKSLTCKTFGENDIECLKSDIIRNNDPVVFGFDFIWGINIGRDSFQFVLEGTISAYVYPLIQSMFSFPVGLRMGIQYRF